MHSITTIVLQYIFLIVIVDTNDSYTKLPSFKSQPPDTKILEF